VGSTPTEAGRPDSLKVKHAAVLSLWLELADAPRLERGPKWGGGSNPSKDTNGK
jgi:hypothetical protein